MEYFVEWTIEIDADSPEQAAAKAETIQRDRSPANTATVFKVWERDDMGNDPVIVDMSEQRKRELGTVLAALRLWQSTKNVQELPEWAIATDEGSILDPLSEDEIDQLCDRLNTE